MSSAIPIFVGLLRLMLGIAALNPTYELQLRIPSLPESCGSHQRYLSGRTPHSILRWCEFGHTAGLSRFDLRAFGRSKLNTYFDLNNVCQRKDIAGYSYDPPTPNATVYAFVLPFSFGVQGEF